MRFIGSFTRHGAHNEVYLDCARGMYAAHGVATCLKTGRKIANRPYFASTDLGVVGRAALCLLKKKATLLPTPIDGHLLPPAA